MDVHQDVDPNSNSIIVAVQMNADGTDLWAAMTRKNIRRAIAIVVDHTVYSAPVVMSEIIDGNCWISGNFTIEEARDFANMLTSGTLPVEFSIVSETVTGSSKDH
jgi:SecD/SecF fusion protein